MTRKLEDYAHIEDEAVALLQKLLAELPSGVASLDVKNVSGGTVAVLKPTNGGSACVALHAENGLPLIDFSFGEYAPTWELPLEGRNRDANKIALLLEVEGLCGAVIAGQCEHKREFLSVSGEIRVAGPPYKCREMLVWRVSPPLKGTRKYEPYLAGR
jgi:hypothetical protein